MTPPLWDETLLTPAARPDPRRTDGAIYPVHKRVPFRLTDIDAFGHVNNVAINALHQEARAALLDRLWPPVDGIRPIQTIAVAHVSHFLAEGFYPGEAECCSAVGRVATNSFVLGTMLRDGDGRCLSVADTVFVLRVAGGAIHPLDENEHTLLAGYAFRV